jgi:transcriptional regulator with XRE-family HTH domain
MTFEEPHPAGGLGAFLRGHRLAIDPNAPSIGPYERIPRRIGRRVTQEELAEAIGVSREWYSRLENGTAWHASAPLLRTIAAALALDESERQRMLSYAPSDLALANAQFAQAAIDGILSSVSRLRRFVQHVTAASSFSEAVELAVVTSQELVRADCVTTMSLEVPGGGLAGFAAGPRARYWTPLNDRVTFESQDPLRHGGVGIVERAPAADEIADRLKAEIACVRRNGGTHAYNFELAAETWLRANRYLEGRSGVAVPLFERGIYRGVLCSSWTTPRKIDDLEIEVMKTTATVVELTASRAGRRSP